MRDIQMLGAPTRAIATFTSYELTLSLLNSAPFTNVRDLANVIAGGGVPLHDVSHLADELAAFRSGSVSSHQLRFSGQLTNAVPTNSRATG